jgi:hypothetical protein
MGSSRFEADLLWWQEKGRSAFSCRPQRRIWYNNTKVTTHLCISSFHCHTRSNGCIGEQAKKLPQAVELVGMDIFLVCGPCFG